MGQPVAMFEIISPDHERARTFYSRLFDWKMQTGDAMGDYALVDTQSGDASIGGGLGPSEASGGAGVKIYVRVDDLDAYLARAEELGGTRVVSPTDLPEGYGRFAILNDPDGNPVGLWA
jgi:predicted enzyme related to lactoylglutathione lyase